TFAACFREAHSVLASRRPTFTSPVTRRWSRWRTQRPSGWRETPPRLKTRAKDSTSTGGSLTGRGSLRTISGTAIDPCLLTDDRKDDSCDVTRGGSGALRT